MDLRHLFSGRHKGPETALANVGLMKVVSGTNIYIFLEVYKTNIFFYSYYYNIVIKIKIYFYKYNLILWLSRASVPLTQNLLKRIFTNGGKMAIKNIVFENFMGKTSSMDFNDSVNIICGPNGSGKSTAKEAMCFLFTGCDSLCKRRPIHLISQSEDHLKVTATTSKAKISRTLSRAGNGTLKIVKNDGITINLKQSDFINMVGSEDLFLSIFTPGYFINLPVTKQHKVLSEVTESFDRFSLLTELTGIQMTDEEKRLYPLNSDVRLDLIQNRIAELRREKDRDFMRLSGELSVLSKEIVVPKMPVDNGQKNTFNRKSSVLKQHERYNSDLKRYNERIEQVKQINIDNEKKEHKRKELQTRIDSIVIEPLQEQESLTLKLNELRRNLKQQPPKPICTNVAGVGHCHACGQIVGEKHRESVIQKNENIINEWKKECTTVNDHNKALREKILDIEKQETIARIERDQKLQEHRRLERIGNDLKVEIAGLSPTRPPMGELTKPVEPLELASQEDVDKAKSDLELFEREVAEYKFYKRKADESDAKTSSTKAAVKEFALQISKLRELEAGVAKLPDHEIRKKSEMFKINDFVKLVVDKNVNMTIGSLPYHLESTGNQMKANILLSLKLNLLSKTPVNTMFIDNADLVDYLPIKESGIQVFTAIVDHEEGSPLRVSE